jgi:hypothetical protein
MDLEEAATLAVGEDGREMLGLEACARKPRHRIRRKTDSRRFQLDVRGRVMSHRWSAAFRPSRVAFVTLIDYVGVSEPFLPFGRTMDVQVPPRTNFHEFPWKSTVEVP